MGILLNHSKGAVEARREWLSTVQLKRVINFADLCFQLFEGAARPAALALFSLLDMRAKDYRFEYWTPKANRLLGSARMLVITSVDRSEVRVSAAYGDRFFWKRRMWATGRDLKLLDWLSDLPRLGRILSAYRSSRSRSSRVSADKWMIGQGFQQLHGDTVRGLAHGYADDETITELPFLDSKDFQPWVIPIVTTRP